MCVFVLSVSKCVDPVRFCLSSSASAGGAAARSVATTTLLFCWQLHRLCVAALTCLCSRACPRCFSRAQVPRLQRAVGVSTQVAGIAAEPSLSVRFCRVREWVGLRRHQYCHHGVTVLLAHTTPCALRRCQVPGQQPTVRVSTQVAGVAGEP